jgi:mevalonate kinase
VRETRIRVSSPLCATDSSKEEIQKTEFGGALTGGGGGGAYRALVKNMKIKTAWKTYA